MPQAPQTRTDIGGTEGRQVVTRSVTMYPDDWVPVIEDAWRQRISMSENLRRIVRKYYHLEAKKEVA